MGLPDGTRGVLLDVEGTVTPISFVHQTLFPFARVRLESCCAGAATDDGVARAVRQLREEHAEDSHGVEFLDGARYAAALMDRDAKSTGLKWLQGLIWEEGYRSGELVAPLFDDVQAAFEHWRQRGVRLRIFSSGSVLAQKLLFAHTDCGDLSGLLEGYHDTSIGPKRSPEAYRAISDQFGLARREILFLSDVVEELDAARSAGLQTGLLVRPGNQPVETTDHPSYRDFTPLLD